MTRKEQIRKLVKYALSDRSTDNMVVPLGVVTESQAKRIKQKAGFDVTGYVRVIDRSSISHTMKWHGNEQSEARRGQVAVTARDFEKIPDIVKTENLIYTGKSKKGADCLLYEAVIGSVFYYVEEIRTGRRQLAMVTMYKRKPVRKRTGK